MTIVKGATTVREALGSALADMHFTPMERKLMIALSDGEFHGFKELIPIVDELATRINVSDHISNIQRKIERINHFIICEFNKRRIGYRYVIRVQALLS